MTNGCGVNQRHLVFVSFLSESLVQRAVSRASPFRRGPRQWVLPSVWFFDVLHPPSFRLKSNLHGVQEPGGNTTSNLLRSSAPSLLQRAIRLGLGPRGEGGVDQIRVIVMRPLPHGRIVGPTRRVSSGSKSRHDELSDAGRAPDIRVALGHGFRHGGGKTVT